MNSCFVMSFMPRLCVVEPPFCPDCGKPFPLVYAHKQCRPRSDCSLRSSLFRVYTICDSICNFWLHYCIVKPTIQINFQNSICKFFGCSNALIFMVVFLAFLPRPAYAHMKPGLVVFLAFLPRPAYAHMKPGLSTSRCL